MLISPVEFAEIGPHNRKSGWRKKIRITWHFSLKSGKDANRPVFG